MKMAPETKVIDNPMMAERVRNVRYEPMKYNQDEDDAKYERKPSNSSKTKSENKRHEEEKSKPQNQTS